jgi:agmatine deiminase
MSSPNPFAALNGFRMPAESAPHERTLIAFPCREELWKGRLRDGQLAWTHVARTVAEYEPVTMLARPSDTTLAQDLCAHGNVEVVAMPLDDSWLRDTAPIYVTRGNERQALDFGFNGWGSKYLPCDNDDAIPANWAAHAGHETVRVPMILEGGSITVDGAGTLITTEQCLLNPNRNPAMSRAQIEATLAATLGIERTIWLPYAIDDRDTDGHVDLVAMFIEPGRVVWQGCDDPRDPEYERLAISRRCLDGARDAAGRAIEVVDLPTLPYCDVDGERLPVPYANLYLCNGAVIVPVTGHPADAAALATIGGCWPDRDVVPVPGNVIAFGGGGPHCMTQQIPAC